MGRKPKVCRDRATSETAYAKRKTEAGGDLDLGGVILKLDEVIRRLTTRAD